VARCLLLAVGPFSLYPAARLSGGPALGTTTLKIVDLAEYLLLAQNGNGGAPPPGAGGGGLVSMLFPLLAIGFLFYFLLLRPERQKQRAHQTLLEGLKKNDRVITSGGIKGVVTGVNRDAEEVVLRVDEATGAKIRITLGSIARVISETTAEENEK